MRTPTCLRPLTLIPLGLLLVLLAGCSSEPGSDLRSGRAGHHSPPPKPMAGQETYFDGSIVAVLKVGPDAELGDLPDQGAAPKASSDSGGQGKHGGGGGGGFGMGGGGGGRGHGSHGGGGSHSADGDSGGGSEVAHPMMGNRGPLVMIHLRFTNQGSSRVELYIEDFNSPLGNFAVQPEKLALDPGQSLETEPMSSVLSDSLTETEASLVLRIADKSEKKVIVLRTVPSAPQTDGPAGPQGEGAPPPENPAAKPGA
jgi:hypothetical protein